MSPLYRLTIAPRSPWRTPWQADTITGLLLATAARTLGPDVLRSRLIDPMLAGEPPFVLSDAMPGDLLPFPVYFRLADWSDAPSPKFVKRARWLASDAFNLARAGRRPPVDVLLSDADVFLDETRRHNTLSRFDDASFSSDEGGGIYQRPETLLLQRKRDEKTGDLLPNPALDGAPHLSLYFRLLDRTAGDLLLDLLHQLSLTGFGADTSTGRGQFDLPDDPVPASELDAPPTSANAVLSLSTFHPGPADPTDGCWDAFPKFGKLGPDLGLADVRKNTLILLRPGACFLTDAARPFLGRAISMHELLPAPSAQTLTARGIAVIHPAFGLTVPATFQRGVFP